MAWLDNHEQRAAFEKANEVWDNLPGAVHFEARDTDDRPARPHRLLLAAGLAMAMAAIALLIGPVWPSALPVYETGVGEQQSVILDDGTRIALNTNSSVTVDYSGHTRAVRLNRGEAMFEVSKDASRPFTVTSQGRQVRALGTSFIVRDDPRGLAVTLVEGSVEVSRLQDERPVRVAVLTPGERITMLGKVGAVVDRPPLDTIVAWRRGEVMFDDVPLIDAANEFNRYTSNSWVEVAPEVGALRVSGVFSTRDPAIFATTIADLYGLDVQPNGKKILIRAADSAKAAN